VTSLISNDLTFSKNKDPRFVLIQKFSKPFIYKIYGDDPTILKTTILQIFDKWISITFEKT
jgi:uncharacterized membrane protein